MSKNILIRSVSDNVHKWIEEERDRRRMTQQEFVNQVLESASVYGQPSLFDRLAPASQLSPEKLSQQFLLPVFDINFYPLYLSRNGRTQ